MPSSNIGIWRYVKRKLSQPSYEGDIPIDPSHFGGLLVPAEPVDPGLAPYTHVQSTMSTSWVINHGLGRIGSITTYENDGLEVSGRVVSNGLNTSNVVFGVAIAGIAYCI